MSGDYNEAIEAAAEIVSAECKRVLSKQTENADPLSIDATINANIRMMACILPEIESAILALRRPGDAGDDGWRTMESAPKDGTVIELTWMENGKPQEIWPMQWGHIKKNGFFPGKQGMWMTPDGAITWNDDHPDGAPTHWRPARQLNAGGR